MPKNTQQTRMFATLIATLATAGIAATAQAGDAAKPSTRYGDVVVQYSDLDLNSAAGNKVLYARLSAAAERACGNEPSARELKRQVQYRACYDKALNRAVDKIGSRELQALHTSKDHAQRGLNDLERALPQGGITRTRPALFQSLLQSLTRATGNTIWNPSMRAAVSTVARARSGNSAGSKRH